MKITVANGVVTINTGIAIKALKENENKIDVFDRKGDVAYTVAYEAGSRPKFTKNFITCNGSVDGNAACIMVAPEGYTLDDVKKDYKAAITAAYSPLLAMAKQVRVIEKQYEAVFTEVTSDKADDVEAEVETAEPATETADTVDAE